MYLWSKKRVLHPDLLSKRLWDVAIYLLSVYSVRTHIQRHTQRHTEAHTEAQSTTISMESGTQGGGA